MQGTEKLVPLEPGKVMVMRKVTENITTLSVRPVDNLLPESANDESQLPFSRAGLMKIGGRATLGIDLSIAFTLKHVPLTLHSQSVFLVAELPASLLSLLPMKFARLSKKWAL